MEAFLSTGVASSQQKESKIEELKGVTWIVKFYYYVINYIILLFHLLILLFLLDPLTYTCTGVLKYIIIVWCIFTLPTFQDLHCIYSCTGFFYFVTDDLLCFVFLKLVEDYKKQVEAQQVSSEIKYEWQIGFKINKSIIHLTLTLKMTTAQVNKPSWINPHQVMID